MVPTPPLRFGDAKRHSHLLQVFISSGAAPSTPTPPLRYGDARRITATAPLTKRVFLLLAQQEYSHLLFCGGGRIRTHETREGLTVFKTAAFDHSATPPIMTRFWRASRTEIWLYYHPMVWAIKKDLSV